MQIKIYIQNPKLILASMMHDGRLLLDLPLDFELSETFTPNKISVFGQIEDDFVVSSTLDITPKNLAIFTAYRRERIPIVIVSGSRVLPYNFISEIQISEASDNIDIQFSSTNPFRLLKDVLLTDLDFENFNYTEGGLLAHWQNDMGAVSVPFYHPICNYGAWTDTAFLIDVKFKDLRCWLREISVLQKMFCKIGWSFKSDIYKTDFGKRIGNYLNGDAFNDRTLLNKFGFTIGFATEQAFSNTVANQVTPTIVKTGSASHSFTGQYGNYTIISNFADNGVTGYYTIANRTFTGLSGNYTLSGDIFVKAGSSLTEGQLIISIYKNGVNISGNISCNGFFTHVFTPNQFSVELADAKPSDVFEIRFVGASTTNSPSLPYSIVVAKSSRIILKAKAVWISEGLNERISKYIDPTYNALDFLKGVIHSFNGLLTINYETKTVELRPTQDIIDVFNVGENIGGYYLPSQVDLRAIQVRDSEVYKTGEADKQLRRLEIGYKTASIYDFKKDFGVEFTEGGVEIRNTFFDSTPTTISHPARLASAPFFPIADFSDIENLNTLQHKISPRRAIFQNKRPSGVAVGANYFKFNGTDRALMPLCYTDAEGLMWGDVVTNENISYKKWAYWVYKDKIKNGEKTESFEALFWVQKHKLHTLDFRKSFVVSFKNRVFLARLKQISDFKNNQDLTTPISFEPIFIDYEC